MARAINKGPKPAGGYGKVSTTAIQQAKEKQARRLAPKLEVKRMRSTPPPPKRVEVYADLAHTVQAALLRAQKHGIAKLDARMLLLHVLVAEPTDTAWLLAHDNDAVNAKQAEAFGAACARRRAGEPVAYILGSKAFYGLKLAVDARVLDPRDDTETLVDWALEIAPSALSPLEGIVRGPATPFTVLDLGTGSGAIALALKSQRPQLQVHASDASADALAVAQSNAIALDLQVQFHQGDWLAPFAGQHFDCIVSNPPYVAAADPHLAALTHEPLSALASGADGLDAIRNIVATAAQHLNAGGWLLVEHGYDQAEAVRTLLTAAGFAKPSSRKDLAGIERCSGAHWPGRG